MKKPPKAENDFIELEETHESKATQKFISEMAGKRGTAFKRMIVWAMANDLYELVRDKIPGGRKYERLRDALTLGEGPKSSFAVFIDNKAQRVSKMDAPNTLIYIKARRIQDRIKPEIKVLSDHSPWTMETDRKSVV